MEQVKHDTAVGNNVKRYKSPKTQVLFVKSHGVLCGSPYGENTEKFGMSGNSYDEGDWE